MLKKITAPRIFTGVLLLFLITITVCALVLPSLGFFQAIFRATGFNSAKVELIFDRLTVTDELAALGYDSSKEWGSEANPYVISQKYHVQNLSVLQNNGFFKEKVDDEGDPVQSFFLVCGQDGKPVAIDCGGMTLAPVGTHENPFTGVIKGAPLAGEARMYDDDDNAENGGGYGTAVSAIANLTVSASVSEPDIGFFGCIGYHGTASTDQATGNPVITDGYAANISNLLLADVTIESRVSWTDTLAKWWESFGGHKRTDDQEETHHIGIVAGHAEFATIADISVFYSSDTIKTFDLASTSTTSYYSITGLVGMLEHVNPAAKDGNLIGGAGNSVSDGDMLIEGGFGGGGTISGSLTGYMMAETLYNEHETTIGESDIGDYANPVPTVDKNGIYDVTDMWKHNPKYNTVDEETGELDTRKYVKLFETVEMKERTSPVGTWQYYDYYVFRDTVFTFAMSTSEKDKGQTTPDGTPIKDYVKKVWKLNGDSTVTVSSDWDYLTDNTVDPSVAYKLEAIQSAPTGDGGYYLLTYHAKGSNTANTEEGYQDDKLYIFEAGGISGNTISYKTVLEYKDFLNGSVTIGDSTYTFDAPEYDAAGNLIGLSVKSSKREYHENSFINSSGNKISHPQGGSLCVTSTKSTGDTVAPVPSLAVSTTNETLTGGFSSEVVYVANAWTFTPHSTIKTRFSISQTFTFHTTFWILDNNYRYGYTKLSFGDEKITANIDTSTSEVLDPGLTDEDCYFTIFKVNKNTVGSDGRITQLGTGNKELTPMNYVATGTTTTFDASKYVLEQQFDSSGAPILANGQPTYALAPIRSYNLNSGKGTYLDQLNHAVQLFRANDHNFQLDFSTVLGGLFGDNLSTNTGGVVGVPVGIGDNAIEATIPTGMIAFNIIEASGDKPSYINVIVAVDPGKTDVGKVGLWHMANNNSWSSSFDVTDPNQSFTLPVSKVASGSADSKYIYNISQSKHFEMNGDTIAVDEKGNPKYVDGGATQTYLGGKTVFVYHSFKVTTAGVYLLGATAEEGENQVPMSVAYFSVSGAAGTGADGSSASPLGNIDFVYANNNNIITVDNKFDGLQNVENEDHTLYYPSYHFVLMIPADTDTGKVQQETIKIYRYLTSSTATTRDARHIKILGCNKAQIKRLADMYQDVLEDGTQNSS